MLRLGRAGLVAAVMVFVGLGVAATVGARDATRDFPTNTYCPVLNYGPGIDQSPFLFTATKSAELLSFVTCDSRNIDGEPYSLDVFIDNLMIVDAKVFNNSDNRMPFTDAITAFGYGDQCYLVNGVVVPPDSVFERTRRYKKGAIAFFENFEGSSANWYLGNASFGSDPESGEANRYLILSRSNRGGSQCSVASVKVNGLAVGRQYVIDFSWRVGMGEVSTAPVPAVSFFIDEPPGR